MRVSGEGAVDADRVFDGRDNGRQRAGGEPGKSGRLTSSLGLYSR